MYTQNSNDQPIDIKELAAMDNFYQMQLSFILLLRQVI